MLTTESPLRDALRLVVWYPLRWLLLALPISAGLFVLRRMGDMHYLASRGKKAHLARCLANLRPGLAPKDMRRAVRSSFHIHYIHQLSIFLFPKFNADPAGQIGRYIEFSGLEHLDAAIRDKRGAVVVLGHHGPTQAPLAALGAMGYPVKQIGYPSDEGLSRIGRSVAFRLRLAYEGKIRAEIVRPGSDLRGLMRHLKAGGLVMTLGDGEGAGRRFGKFAPFPFFGHAVEFPLGPARLAVKSGARLLPMHIEPGRTASFRAVIGAPLEPPRDADSPDAKVLALTAAFLDVFSQAVRENPGWWHFLERFHPGGMLAPSANRPAPPDRDS